MHEKYKKIPDHLPEVFISSTATTRAVGRAVKTARARKLGPRLYTANMTDQPETIVRRNAWRITGLLMPGAVIGYRTGFEGRVPDDGSIFVVGAQRRRLNLPGLQVQMVPGPGPLAGDQPFLEGLYLASRARAILESLKLTRQRKYASRAVSRSAIEEYLDRELRIGGAVKINRIRDDAKRLAPLLDASTAFDILDDMIGTLLGTRKARLNSPVAIARAAGTPYDPNRLDLFHKLHAELLQWTVKSRSDRLPGESEFANVAFFDAYFSNFIEGTEFKVTEAHAIVFDGRIPPARPKDAHDIVGTYRLVGNRDWMSKGMRDMATPDAIVARMVASHADMMAARPDKRPGEFKTEANQAGQTLFVEPELARGTLTLGIDLARSLDTPFARAIMLMFVVSEVHPFDDGNGRVARALMNAELVAGGDRRILVPTVYRNDYLTGLRTLSRTAGPKAFVQVMDHAQEYTARIDFTDYDHALAVLVETDAFMEPGVRADVTVGTETSAMAAKLRLPPPRAIT